MSAPPAPRTPPTTRRGRQRVRRPGGPAINELDYHNGQAHEPTIVARDDLTHERVGGGQYCGRVYFAWMRHDPNGGCDRNPDTDPHEDLGYVGKTARPLHVRWAEHLAADRINERGEHVVNNSAVYRNRTKLTGWSVDDRLYASPDELSAAELRAIKTLWPAWNIQDQDRRNPHSRASRSYRHPDRLAPLIGLASALWALVWAAATAVLAYLPLTLSAAWYYVAACPLLAGWITSRAVRRHRGATGRRARKLGQKNRRKRS